MRVLNFFKTLRNNWKKSIVGTVALSYGVSYSKEVYDTDQLMRHYCEHAVKYGDTPCPTYVKPQRVTVILNPAAKKRKAKKLFEKYCEPLLHLAGIAVTIIQTESEGQARSLVASLDVPTDSILVAGGDGTLSEVITGLMRKCNSNLATVKQCPVGILPLGETNRIADNMFFEYGYLSNVQRMIDATMAVINGNTKTVDVIKVEPLKQDTDEPIKPIYAVGVVEWGPWQDAHHRRNKYWYYGSLRQYATYIFNGYKNDLNWKCNAIMHYTDPCKGCSRCYKEDESVNDSVHTNRRWWHAFLPRKKPTLRGDVNYSNVQNEKCGIVHEMPVSTTEMYMKSANVGRSTSNTESALEVQLGPENIGYRQFVSEGWRRVNGNKTLIDETLKVKTIELHPEETDKEQTFYIDNEEFELKPVKIQLISDAIRMYCPDSKNTT